MRRPPGRAVAALGSALRAFVCNVLLVAALGAVAGAVTVTLWSLDAIAGTFGFFGGVFFGAIFGAVAGGVHAAAQALLMLVVPADRRRPASPVVAVLVSLALAVGVYLTEGREPERDSREALALAVAGAVYVLATWPVANALFAPGRPRRRTG